MIFIINLIIYIVFACIMSAFARKSYTLYDDEYRIDNLEWAYILFFTAICAFRWNTGVDSVAYTIRFIRGFEPDEGNTEYIYNYLTNFIADNQIPFSFGTGLLAFLQIFPLVGALRNNRYILITMPILLFGNCYFLSYMNAVRQMIAASMFFFACRYINEKRIVPYIIVILIGTLIHHSAAMMLPLFVLAFFQKWITKLNDKRTLLMAIYIMCIIIGMTPSFQGLISFAEQYSQIFGYDNYTDRMQMFLGSDYSEEAHSYGIMMISYILIGAFIIWYGPILKDKYGDSIPCFNLWYFLAFAYGCLYFLVCNVSHVFIRPIMYFQPFQLVIASLLLWEFISQQRYRNIAIVFIIVIWSECAWNLYKNQFDYSSSNYHLVWFYDLSKFYLTR